MKKAISSSLLFLLCAACGAGAFFFLRKSDIPNEKQQYLKIIGVEEIVIQKGESILEALANTQAFKDAENIEFDVSRVDTAQEGVYPIEYKITGKDGKIYQGKISCTVTEKQDRKNAGEEDEENVPDFGTEDGNINGAEQERVSPKTGDDKIAIYVFVMAVSLDLAIRSYSAWKHQGRI